MLKNSSGDSSVEVAKITALQAVVVAIITTVAGAAVGYVGKPSSQITPSQRWIVIDGAESQIYPFVRIVATINGVHFSYPSNAVWAGIGPSMPKERFPIPSADSYNVSFRAFLNGGPDDVLNGEANYVESISQIPSGDRAYPLYPIKGVYRQPGPVLSVRYHLE